MIRKPGFINMWPFDQPTNCATIVSKSILDGSRPVLYIAHDEDDHGWQFLDAVSEELDDLAIVGLGHVLDLDPTLAVLAHLQPGYHATRSSPNSEWVIVKTPPESDVET